MMECRVAELARETVAGAGVALRLATPVARLVLSKEEDQWLRKVVETAFCSRPVISPGLKTGEFVVRNSSAKLF